MPPSRDIGRTGFKELANDSTPDPNLSPNLNPNPRWDLGRGLAHDVSLNPDNNLKMYSDGSLPICMARSVAPEVQWQRAMFCGMKHLPASVTPAGGIPYYEMDPLTSRPFANIVQLRRAKAAHYSREIAATFPHTHHVKLETLLGFSADGEVGPWRGGVDRSEGARITWLTTLQQNYDLPIRRDQFPHTATHRTNAKTGQPFSSVAYISGMYYSRALLHDKAACRALLSDADAEFIASQLDDDTERALGYAKLEC